jgi:hypothetical protein
MLKSQHTFYHFSCSSRRDSILQNGLLAGSNACLNDNPTNKLYFVRYPQGDLRPEFAIDRDKAEFVLCMIKDKCFDNFGQLDVWRFVNVDNVIVNHTIPGEYVLKTTEESPVVAEWSNGSRLRIPPVKIELISEVRLPSGLKQYLITNDYRSRKDDLRCKDKTNIKIKKR